MVKRTYRNLMSKKNPIIAEKVETTSKEPKMYKIIATTCQASLYSPITKKSLLKFLILLPIKKQATPITQFIIAPIIKQNLTTKEQKPIL
ncbi:hypothetical protein TTHERM_000160629 (macronuclear) [Tetrahymena thermophila SB210]|uniref:Uncharacterized protein n=1 Tax=Tetrahymena thermophila (strain SB210) TaxID=312017 RepID=W7X995_TETTS|nr:hypothetical protein TTHERM_000160629 [Tetrahymena thermophila SB210]EWS75965.1 hypothetical protein TTHERM_000160629 [Tetrahymena thermophila SB210]|eukprot:XP_012651483.1 hypothetical protein TTHERM_000160629 [Tetrahymena thermophila SB210]